MDFIMNFLDKHLKRTVMNRIILAVLAVAVLWGCDDFGNLNVDPNNPSEAQTSLLLTDAQRNIDNYIGAVTGTLYIQYISETQYTDASRYGSSSFNFDFWYSNPLINLQTIIDLNTNEETRDEVLAGGSNANQIAVARILKAYFFHGMTDRWGMIPYSEALQGNDEDGTLRPSYDPQPDIYADLLKELDEAASQINPAEDPVTGDILFDGDMNRWIRFANSLRMRLALRIAETNESLGMQHFTDAYNDGMISEDVTYNYLASANNENPWYSRFRTRTDYAISEPMADKLKAHSDYRLTKYANPAPDSDDGDGTVELDEIVGMPYGIENAGDITNASISFPGAAIGAGGPNVGVQDAPLPIITVAELKFALAEAVERGWITGSAENFYMDGIERSWRQWNVYNATDFGNYVAQNDIAYSSAEWRQKIGYQKWIALFPLGYEAWSEWRRLDYPELDPAPVPLNQSGNIPVRQGYPSSEAELNEENYNSAVQNQGITTGLDTRVWWDIQ